MHLCFKKFRASVSQQEPFCFLGDTAMTKFNMKYVHDFDKDYTSKIDFQSADPEDRAELRRMANRQIRRNIRQALKANLQNFLLD